MNPNTVLLLLFALVFFLFILRPQMKRNKEQKQFSQSLGKGDKVVTNGGIHGKVVEVKDQTVVIEVGGGVNLTVDRSAINMEFTKQAFKND